MIESLTTIMAQAAHLLQRSGIVAELSDPRILKDQMRSQVIRAQLQSADLAAHSLIIKHLRDDEATGYAEWAGLAFLTEISAAHGLAPAFYGGDIVTRLVLLEDLGPARTLHDLLREDDDALVTATLEALARQMARLHLATYGHEDRHLALRMALPAAASHGRQHEAANWLAARERMQAWWPATECAIPPGFDAALEQIAAVYAEPGAWLSFSHGDPAPSNNHIAGSQVHLLDFEFAAFRHSLYDLSAWNVLCPLRPAFVDAMLRAFRATLTAPFPQTDAAFAREWAMLCAYRGLAILSWIAPSILEQDRPMVEEWTARRAVLAAATRSAAAVAAEPELAPVALALANLRDALRTRWPELGPNPAAYEHA